jgi:hypothetical protein
MTENNIPKLPVPPASWKLDWALARSTSQPESAAQAMQALDRLESEIAQAPADRGSWGAPEYVTVASIRVHPDRLPVDEDVVEGIVATIKSGNVNALPGSMMTVRVEFEMRRAASWCTYCGGRSKGAGSLDLR